MRRLWIQGGVTAKGQPMTADIGEQQRMRALKTPAPGAGQPTRHSRLVVGITCFGVGATVTGLILVAEDLTDRVGFHFAVYAAACFVLAGLAGTLLVLRAMLADCQAFYRRGHLDGWIKGWNGQNPETGDPLLK